MRRNFLLLAHDYSTPLEWWMDLPLSELGHWIAASNRMGQEQKK